MQDYCNNWNQVLKEQLIGANINQNYPTRAKTIFRLLKWSKYLQLNRLFVLSFENTTDRTVHTKYYLTTVEIKDYNVMIDGQNFFD